MRNLSRKERKCCLLSVSLLEIAAPRESLSSIPNRAPASSGASIMTDRQNESKVLVCTSLDSLCIPRSDRAFFMRSSISLAALRVNVSSSTSLGDTSSREIRLM